MRATTQVTSFRRTTAIALAVIAVPVTALSFLDPLEGGMALVAAFTLNRLVRYLSDVHAPRLYMWSVAAAAVVGATALGLAVAQGEKGEWWIVMPLAYLYSAITVFVTLGSVLYARDVLKALGASGTAHPAA